MNILTSAGILTIGISLLVTTTITSLYTYNENKNLNEILKIKNKEIEKVSYKNKTLKYRNINKNELIKKYQKIIKTISRENQKLKFNKNNKYEDKIIKNNKTRVIHVNNKNIYKNTNNIKQKINKIYYQKFSNNIKLISDSKIRINEENKIISNAPIYGRYYAKAYSYLNPQKNQISNIKCGLKNNRYNVTDDCSMEISDSHDLVYLGTMDAKHIRNFNYRTHMIECDYSKKYGIMHNCQIKIY